MYTVNWNVVDPQLLNYWLAASSALRRAITDACNRLDRQLRQHPKDGAVTADADFLMMFVHPVRAYYQVIDSRREVTVTGISILKS